MRDEDYAYETQRQKRIDSMTDWTELKTGKEVFDRAAEGWEIEGADWVTGLWVVWSGNYWDSKGRYRGRTKQPKKVTVTYECYDAEGRLLWRHPRLSIMRGWIRVPELDKTVEREL